MKQRIYISGPMSGLPREEYLARFARAEAALRHFGRVVNPARLAPCRWPWLYRLIGYRKTLAWDLRVLRRCDTIAVMPGYERSRGARLEMMKAREWNLNIIHL